MRIYQLMENYQHTYKDITKTKCESNFNSALNCSPQSTLITTELKEILPIHTADYIFI